jgi:pimeloyl-ACP methyl ester carboxylesterase
MHRRPIAVAVAFAIALVLVCPYPIGQELSATAAQVATPAAVASTAANRDFAGLVDIGGRSLFLECRGTGSPTVILEAGYGNNAQNWDTVGLPAGSAQPAVLPGVAAFTRVCAYDRPGTILDREHRSRSDPAPMPRDASAMVADLHALLTAAAVPGPYVLAGHSFGGLIARLYAATYPDDVVGMVLIDAAHEDYYDEVEAVLASAQRAASTPTPEGLADDPDFEQIDLDASTTAMREAAAASPLRPMPLVVMTHGLPWDWPAGYPVTELEAIWGPLQDQLAALLPDSRLVVADRSKHFIPGDQPDLVVAGIRQVVEAVRDLSTWTIGPAAAAPIRGEATPTSSTPGMQFTPLLESVLSPPHWFMGTDGQVHLVYELVLTNAIPAPVTVNAVEVLDADAGTTLTRLTGQSLLAAMSLATSPETPAVLLPPATVGVV